MADDTNGKATLREVLIMLQRMEDKIDARLALHGEKIASLERWRSYSTGAAAVLTLIFGSVAAKIWA